MADFNNFTNYKKTESGIIHDLKVLQDYSRKMKLDGNASAIDAVIKRLEENTFNVAVLGEFKRGKSTLINALLAQDVLPMNVLPCSAALNKITYDTEKSVEIIYKDGRKEKIGIELLNDYVTKLTKESEERAKTVKEAIVHYPVRYCENGVTIIDTPGLNDNKEMTEVTLGVLPHSDAALMVIMMQSPFADTERDIVESQLITSDLGRVMFVVTGIDSYKKEDVDTLLKDIARRINESVIAKAERTYGKDSQEFERYKRKIGEVKVHGLSARNALDAKMSNPVDVEMLKASCFPEFEKELERFLTEERGAIKLFVPLNRIKNASIELIKAAQLRSCVLTMKKDEFNKNYDLAIKEMEKIRRERNSEFDCSKDSANKAIQDLEPLIKSYWPDIEKAAMNAVDSYVIKSLDEIKEKPKMDKTLEKMTYAVKNAVSLESQSKAEKVQLAIEAALGKEADRFSGFEAKFYQTTDKIQELFISNIEKQKDDPSKDPIMKIILGPSVGNMLKDYKEAGWKGALVGGAVRTAFFGAGTLIALSVVALPVAIVAMIGSVFFGHLTSKWAINKLFAGHQIQSFKTSFKEAVQKDFDRMKTESSINKSVREQITGAFTALQKKIEIETENKLTDMQRQFDQVKKEAVKNEADCENELKELNSMLEEVDKICLRANEIGKQITEVLSK